MLQAGGLREGRAAFAPQDPCSSFLRGPWGLLESRSPWFSSEREAHVQQTSERLLVCKVLFEVVQGLRRGGRHRGDSQTPALVRSGMRSTGERS